ncbi:hypothetical protein [Bradyrhizobium sp. CB1015]|uniref:hypothetical protein n=1 Tax=Bradyrhizobium sp. CB1015 TaxID=2976822 RepID=UPI0021AA3686|nr:hypothetical protein [Bradyrhizobium sp. CB1015]UWU91374.1 hypothetical protein N2604_33840 [Bradyrhizobium sp. CB1015]
MSRDNNMFLRAKIGPDGSIQSFTLGNYSGGNDFTLRIHQLARGDQYWVVEGNGYGGTVFVDSVDPEFSDFDELCQRVLRDWRQDILHRRDASVRDLIQRRSADLGPAGDLPPIVPTVDELRKAKREAGNSGHTPSP